MKKSDTQPTDLDTLEKSLADVPSAKEVSDQMVRLLVEEYGVGPEEAEEFVGAIRQAAMHEMRERCVARCRWLAEYEHDLSPDHRIGDGSPDAIRTAAEYVSVIPYDDDAWRELRDADLRKLARLDAGDLEGCLRLVVDWLDPDRRDR